MTKKKKLQERVLNIFRKKNQNDITEDNQGPSTAETVDDEIDENNSDPFIDTYLGFTDSVILEKELKSWLRCPGCNSENVTFKMVSKLYYFFKPAYCFSSYFTKEIAY